MEKITNKIKQICLEESLMYNQESSRLFNTPTPNVLNLLSVFPDDAWYIGKTFIDSECGFGQFIVPVAIIKQELGHDEILSCIFGTEIMEDVITTCRKRLLDVCGHTDENTRLVNKNIVCCDSLAYDFDFK